MKIYGIFGFPLKHTLSPAMQEAAFEKTGLDAVYLPLELDPIRFRAVMRRLARTPLEGFNLTIPYKEVILPYLDRVDRDARVIGAVNTVKRSGNKFWGYNTDWQGFVRALEEKGFRIRGKRAVILGAGGAARACVFGLLKKSIGKITIFNRHPEKGRKIRRKFQPVFPGQPIRVFPLRRSLLKPVLEEADLLVNTTPVGLKGKRAPWVDGKIFPRRKIFVYDLIYNPAETPLLRMAGRKKCPALNGLSMLLFQGAGAFEIWTGKKAPEKWMRRVLEKVLAEKS